MTGRQFTGLFGADRTVEVVGVVADVLPAELDAEPEPQVYALQGSAMAMGNATLVVKTEADPVTMAPLLQQVVRQVAPGASLDSVGSLGSKIAASVSGTRFTALVLWAFAAIALTLAATGLYGVLSCMVAQRRREMAVRAALGATRGQLIAMVLREGLGVTTLGLALGLAAAALATRAVNSVLFGIAPLDPVAFSTAPVLLAAVASAACLFPAWRAAAIEPVAALGAE